MVSVMATKIVDRCRKITELLSSDHDSSFRLPRNRKAAAAAAANKEPSPREEAELGCKQNHLTRQATFQARFTLALCPLHRYLSSIDYLLHATKPCSNHTAIQQCFSDNPRLHKFTALTPSLSSPTTMPPRSIKPAAPRLPPLPKLRVRRPNQAEANPCVGIMTSMLSCWASSGYSATGCMALEQSLRACMDEPVGAFLLLYFSGVEWRRRKYGGRVFWGRADRMMVW